MPSTERRNYFLDPAKHAHILGINYAKREHAPILKIGNLEWDRWALGRLGCPHPTAAARLNRVVQELRIRTLAGLADQIHEVGNFKGLGLAAYHTLLAILGEYGYDIDDVHGEAVTFSTLKSRAMLATRKRRTKKPRRAGPPSEAAEGATPS